MHDMDELKLLRDADLCKLLGVSEDTLYEWRQRLGFPRPIFITDGSPRRTPLGRVRRWLDGRERKRRKLIRRGKLKQPVADQ